MKKEPIIVNSPEEVETVDQEDLRKLSQCIKNIKAIIEAHCIEPVEESKELNHTYYLPEIEKLSELLRTPTGISTISDQEVLLASLTDDLILNKVKTERAKKQIEHVDDCLSIALGKVQKMRKYGTTRPTTGLEDGPLKDFLDDFLAKKQIGKDVLAKSNKKRITLPSFPRTEWGSVSVKFIDERNALVSNGVERKPISFESIGCDDGRNGKPDINWEFLSKVAKGKGQTPALSKSDRGSQTKQKQKVTDILRKMFDNDTDPFESEKGGVYRAKFTIGYFEEEIVRVSPTKTEYLDLEEIRSEMTTPTEEQNARDSRDSGAKYIEE
jgi:hypothetical protein